MTRVLSLAVCAAALVTTLDVRPASCQEQKALLTWVPAVDPDKSRIKFFEVESNWLVVDYVRNKRYRSTINSYTDFKYYPHVEAHSHFIPVADTGHGMTLSGGTGRTAKEINLEINKIRKQLPANVMAVTFYQHKDPARFPQRNVFTGPFLKSHPPPHQNFYREN